MHSPENLLEDPLCLEIFLKIFLGGHGIPSPVLPLSQIAHWQTPRSLVPFPHSEIDHEPSWIFGGTLFNFSNPAPSAEQIQTVMHQGKQAGVHQFWVPTVRADSDPQALKDAGFIALPWFVESFFDCQTHVDQDLRMRIGSRNTTLLRRNWAQVHQQYAWTWMEAQQILDPESFIQILADLHAQNAKKYGHAQLQYTVPVLRELFSSPLFPHLLFGLRTHPVAHTPVQMVICLTDRKRGHLHALTLGTDYALAAPSLNFYSALILDLYTYAETQGFTTVYLGRGNQEKKLKLGANRFRLLNHWMHSTRHQTQDKITLLKDSVLQHLPLTVPQVRQRPLPAQVTANKDSGSSPVQS